MHLVGIKRKIDPRLVWLFQKISWYIKFCADWNNMGIVKPLLSFPYLFLSCMYHSFILVPKNCPHNQYIIIYKKIIISDVLFLEVLFTWIIFSEFLVLSHSIVEMIISEKLVAKLVWCFGIYFSCNLPVLVIALTDNMLPHFYQMWMTDELWGQWGGLVVRWQTCVLCLPIVSAVLFLTSCCFPLSLTIKSCMI